MAFGFEGFMVRVRVRRSVKVGVKLKVSFIAV